MKYILIGLRPAQYTEAQSGKDGKMLAILRPVNGTRRLTAIIDEADCTSEEAAFKAIAAYHNKDGIKRVDVSEIAPCGDSLTDLPWIRTPPVSNERTRYDAGNSRLTGTSGLDRSAGAAYRQKASEFSKSNADYLRELESQANFNATDVNFVWSDEAREAARLSRIAHKATDKEVLHGEKEELNKKADSAVNHSAIALNARKADKAEHHHREASKIHRALSGYHEIKGQELSAESHFRAHQMHERAADKAASGKKELAAASFSLPSAPENNALQADNDKSFDALGDAGRAYESAKHAHLVNGSPESHAAAKASETALNLTQRNAGMFADCHYSTDPECSDAACSQAHETAAQLHETAAKNAKVPVPHLAAQDFHERAQAAHEAKQDNAANYSAANFSRGTVDAVFDVSPSPSSAFAGDYVLRDAPIVFKAGQYPDKNFSLSIGEAKAAVSDFDARKQSRPVYLRASHSNNPLDGKIGHIAALGVDANGVISGKVAIPRWLDEEFKGKPIPLSAGFDRVSKKLTHVALVNDPRIAGACMAAFERSGNNNAITALNTGEPSLSDEERKNFLSQSTLGRACLSGSLDRRSEKYQRRLRAQSANQR